MPESSAASFSAPSESHCVLPTFPPRLSATPLQCRRHGVPQRTFFHWLTQQRYAELASFFRELPRRVPGNEQRRDAGTDVPRTADQIDPCVLALQAVVGNNKIERALAERVERM